MSRSPTVRTGSTGVRTPGATRTVRTGYDSARRTGTPSTRAPGTSSVRTSPVRTTTPRTSSRSAGTPAAPRYRAPRAVGGSASIVKSRAATPRTGTQRADARNGNAKVSPRDLYNRVPRSGTVKAGRTSYTSKPVTGDRVADRYRSRLGDRKTTGSPRTGGSTTKARRSDVNRVETRGSQPRAGGSKARGSASAGRSVRDTAGHRYPVKGRTRATGGGRAARAGAAGNGGLRNPTLRPRSTGTRARVPRLNPRVQAGYGGSYSSHSFNRHWGLGVWGGYGSWCGGWGWGWGGWGNCGWGWGGWGWSNCGWGGGWGWGWGGGWRHRACWWWPTAAYLPSYYVPVYGSEVIAVEGEAPPAEGEVVVVGGGVDPAESMAALADKYVALGDFYFKENRFAEAADAYARARTYAPDDASIHFVLADALFATGDYHFAAFLISEALRLDPGLARAEADKRTFYSDPKIFEEQMQTLMKYLEERPYDAMGHLVLGYNLKFSMRPDEAKLAFRKVLEIDPSDAAAKVFLEALTPPAPAELKKVEDKK